MGEYKKIKHDRAIGNCYDYNIADFKVEGDPEV